MYNSEMIKLYLHMSLERLVNDEEYSALEAYSSALSHRMLSETAPHKQYLSNQKALLEEGALPAPIYNAVSLVAQQSGVGMKWLELSPWECGCADIGQGVFVPTWSFGRQFNDGVSVSSFKEKPLGFLLAVLGGPFVASFRRMLDEIEHELPPELGTALSTILLKGNLNDNVVLQPAQIHNFLLGLKCLTGDDAKVRVCVWSMFLGTIADMSYECIYDMGKRLGAVDMSGGGG
ncbi:hypothetical protein SARC_10336 [Sphaeroforma arctica JP610]|uniref:PLA2c domain-containing protein n=1 Tax=Sphaeroforma arctica JP610 TaxID=667725 RepID=A0A0L0FK97_9EUKA|nr:hypothetical protein SARC_10336 [Sphaeroforma arctica JP610]KNC77197.1 hypothetical protein SARC_10336 [Sphaeroforma arctica JP610]|eukprot:XP_014151099.1 hypothetical protein SARC_10336 [Sphaeroforma arctica JP610]